jgi:hypothetical protein
MKLYNRLEPLMANRFIIETKPTIITQYLFRKYKMYNEGGSIIFKTEFLETTEETFNPFELLEITDISLQYLNPIGEIVGGFNMTVKGVNFKKSHSYDDGGLLITKMRFIIDKITLIDQKPQKVDLSYGQPKE